MLYLLYQTKNKSYIDKNVACEYGLYESTAEENYDIKYIGMGVYDKTTSVRRKRPFMHRDDLLNDNLKINSTRYGVFFPSITLDRYSAYQLESYLIDAALKSGYSLTPRKTRNEITPKMQLWNKIRGHKINGDYIRKVA